MGGHDTSRSPTPTRVSTDAFPSITLPLLRTLSFHLDFPFSSLVVLSLRWQSPFILFTYHLFTPTFPNISPEYWFQNTCLIQLWYPVKHLWHWWKTSTSTCVLPNKPLRSIFHSHYLQSLEYQWIFLTLSLCTRSSWNALLLCPAPLEKTGSDWCKLKRIIMATLLLNIAKLAPL